MPSKESFDSLIAAIKDNNLDAVKNLLHPKDDASTTTAKDLLETKNDKGDTPLMCACLSLDEKVDLPMIKLLYEEIKSISDDKNFWRDQLFKQDENGWSPFLIAVLVSNDSDSTVRFFIENIIARPENGSSLQEQLSLTNKAGWNTLMAACMARSSHAVLKLIVKTIAEVGGTEFLKTLLQVKDREDKTAFTHAAENAFEDGDSLVFVASLLYELNLFKTQYAELTDAQKYCPEENGIDSEDWKPKDNNFAEIKSIIGTTVSKSDVVAANEKTQEETV